MENICLKKRKQNCLANTDTSNFMWVGLETIYIYKKREYRLKSGYNPESEQSCEEDKNCLIFFLCALPSDHFSGITQKHL